MVFPLMPWKNYTKKRQNSDFFVVFFTYLQKKRKAPQPHNQGGGAATDGGTGRGELPSQQFLQRLPSHGKQESTALVAGVNAGLATRGLGLEAPQFIRSLVSR